MMVPAASDQVSCPERSGFLVKRPGPLTTIQDLGRPGHASLGVSRSGAADRGSLKRANALVGNPPTAASLEMTLGGLVMQYLAGQDRAGTTGDSAGLTIAVTGASLPIKVTDVNGVRSEKPCDKAFEVLPGDLLQFGRPAIGLRSYLAVRGGIDAPSVLGSRSTDVLSGLGPDPVAAGLELTIGTIAELSQPPPKSPAFQAHAGITTLRVRFGPRQNWFTAAGQLSFLTQEWTVSPDSNRIGMRLSGAAIQRLRHDELPSEALLPGAVQVPPAGLPLIFLADHPVTGGYPVIGVVASEDLDLAAQCRPGGKLQFRQIQS